MSSTDSSAGREGDGDYQRVSGEVAEDPSLFTTATTNFYRGEVERMVGWRNRLDQTTNWAVVLMAAILTFAFASQDNPHYILLVGFLGVGAFMIIEAQRYQEYDAWRHRVRLFQRYFLADVASPSADTQSDWRERLGSDLREPSLTISFWKALGHRLEHVYLLLFTVLMATWVLRITVFDADETWVQTASIGDISGPVVAVVVGVVYLSLCGFSAWSIYQSRLREF